MSDFVLYNYFRSSTSYRVRIALNLKGIRYTYKPVHLINNGGEQNRPEYRSLNPTGGVPTLVHEGRAIGESMAICEYLEQIRNDFPLLPKSPGEAARVRQFCETINSGIHSYQNLKTTQYLEKVLAISENQKNAWLEHWIANGLTALETQVEKSADTFCFGAVVTLADVFLVPQIFTAQRFKIDTSKYPTLMKIVKNCEAIEAFKQAHPFCQPDTPAELKRPS